MERITLPFVQASRSKQEPALMASLQGVGVGSTKTHKAEGPLTLWTGQARKRPIQSEKTNPPGAMTSGSRQGFKGAAQAMLGLF